MTRLMENKVICIGLSSVVLCLICHYAESLKCWECHDCQRPGVENKTCFVDDGYCMSLVIQEKEKDKDGTVIYDKEVVRHHRRCVDKTKLFLKGRALTCSQVNNRKNIYCCKNQDYCNSITPVLRPKPSVKKEGKVEACH